MVDAVLGSACDGEGVLAGNPAIFGSSHNGAVNVVGDGYADGLRLHGCIFGCHNVNVVAFDQIDRVGSGEVVNHGAFQQLVVVVLVHVEHENGCLACDRERVRTGEPASFRSCHNNALHLADDVNVDGHGSHVLGHMDGVAVGHLCRVLGRGIIQSRAIQQDWLVIGADAVNRDRSLARNSEGILTVKPAVFRLCYKSAFHVVDDGHGDGSTLAESQRIGRGCEVTRGFSGVDACVGLINVAGIVLRTVATNELGVTGKHVARVGHLCGDKHVRHVNSGELTAAKAVEHELHVLDIAGVKAGQVQSRDTGHVGKHAIHGSHVVRIKAGNIQFRHFTAIPEHALHGSHFFGVKTGHVQRDKTSTVIEHMIHRCNIARIKTGQVQSSECGATIKHADHTLDIDGVQPLDVIDGCQFRATIKPLCSAGRSNLAVKGHSRDTCSVAIPRQIRCAGDSKGVDIVAHNGASATGLKVAANLEYQLAVVIQDGVHLGEHSIEERVVGLIDRAIAVHIYDVFPEGAKRLCSIQILAQ